MSGRPLKRRTAALLVGATTLLLAVPFAVAAWASGGTAGLLASVVPLVGCLALSGGAAHLVCRPGGDGVTRQASSPPARGTASSAQVASRRVTRPGA